MTLPTATRHTATDSGPPPRQSGTWLTPLVLRLHFYAGVLVGPFILVAALTGGLYALVPQIENQVYREQLSAPVTATTVPLADQIEAALAYTGRTAASTPCAPPRRQATPPECCSPTPRSGIRTSGRLRRPRHGTRPR